MFNTYNEGALIFDSSFVTYDLIFSFLWIILLMRSEDILENKFRSLAISFGISFFILLFVIEDVWFFHSMGIRTVDGVIQGDLFLLYFCFIKGMIKFTYMIKMLEFCFIEKCFKNILYWTAILIIGEF
jgi:hypothetical protein